MPSAWLLLLYCATHGAPWTRPRTQRNTIGQFRRRSSTFWRSKSSASLPRHRPGMRLASCTRFRWRYVAPGGVDSLTCVFYAPHVGMPLLERVHFWTLLRASSQEVLHSHPRARLVLAGDSNVYLSEVMGCGREGPGESQIRGLCQDFGLGIYNPFGVPTHRSGSSIDLVLASRDLPIRNLVVHDGSTCACSPNTCCPASGSDHKLITFQTLLPSPTEDTASPRWPRVRNWLQGLSTCFGARLAPRRLVLPVIGPGLLGGTTSAVL